MSRIFKYRWFAIALLLLGLLLFLIFHIFSPTSGNPTGISTPLPGITPHIANSAIPLTGTPQITSTSAPTPTSIPLDQPLQLSIDPYTNSTSQHRTEVEPGSYAYGPTIVAAFQAGRFIDVGSSNIGWATSTDSGSTWQHGFLPGTTKYAGGSYDRITDPSVAYDAAHNTWMIATVVFVETRTGIAAPAVLVSLSTNGGTVWSNPVTVSDVGNNGGLDKDWITCDVTSNSPFYGNCYIQWDDYARGDLILISTSSDGGKTWGTAKTTADGASGTSGYPLVQPDGTVIVPISNANQTAIIVFRSTNGGASWSRTTLLTHVTSFASSAYFHDDILLTPSVDSAGKAYLVWVDCRFEPNCRGNDLVMTTSTDGLTWSPVQRIPIAPVGSGTNYYVSGLGIDQSSSGAAIRLGLTYYYYPASCASNCALSVGFVSSSNAGIAWSSRIKLAGPIPGTWIAQGNNKVGDYITTSFSNGRAFPVFAIATAPSSSHFNEAMYTIAGGIA